MDKQGELKGSEHKVLIGFKCNPALKLALCKQAEELGVTLSSHVETLVSAVHENKAMSPQELLEQIKELKERIDFYEQSPLKDLYKQHKGETVSYKNKDNEKRSIRIDRIQDAFTVVINSFKTT